MESKVIDSMLLAASSARTIVFRCSLALCLAFAVLLTLDKFVYSSGSSAEVPTGPCGGRNPPGCVPPPLRKAHCDYQIRAASQYRLASCPIDKSMSTVLTGMMCFLTNETAFERAGRSVTTEVFNPNRFCKDENEFSSIEHMQRNTSSRTEEWFFFTIVREPIDRFLSAFVDKCLFEKLSPEIERTRCYGCAANLSCVVHALWRRAWDFGTEQLEEWNYEDRHFLPQNWHCNFQSHFPKYYFINHEKTVRSGYNTTLEKLDTVLKQSSVPETSRKRIFDEIRAAKTSHATGATAERVRYESILRADHNLMQTLLRTYFYDYVLFDFAFPEIS